MTNNKLLDQEEIDLLMRSHMEALEDAPTAMEQPTMQEEVLAPEEKDALGEVGNISMGSASTTLSELLSQKVSITHPRVWMTTKKDLFTSFKIPYLVIKVDFIDGLKGFNILVMKVEDALVVANLMMGGDGNPMETELTEMEISAASEAMNMMIGSASTSLSQMFNKPINISPPRSTVLKDMESAVNDAMPEVEDNATLVVVSFNMAIGEKVDTEIMQIMGVETAKEKAALLWQDLNDMMAENEPAIMEQPAAEAAAMPDTGYHQPYAPPEPQVSHAAAFGGALPSFAPPTPTHAPPPRNLDLILDIPLKVSVVLGRTKKPIKEVLNIGPGSVVELDSLADEPVEILVNGTLVAEGQVVVVNENFGVKITNIVSPAERIQRLAK